MTRGAIDCWKLLDWYRNRFGSVHPSQEKIAAHMKCTVRTVKRHIQELREAGCIEVQRRGRDSAVYLVEKYTEEAVEKAVNKKCKTPEISAKPVDAVPSNVPLGVPSNVPSIHYIFPSFGVTELKQQQSARLRQSDYGSLTQKPNPDTPSSDPLEPSGSLSVPLKLQRKPMEFARDIERLAQTMRLGGGP